MLKVFPKAEAGAEGLAKAVWIDLLNPGAKEAADVEAVLGAPLPSVEALSEIEASSRLRRRDDVLYMSMPSAAPHEPEDRASRPVGFVLSADRLITVRFGSAPSFEAVAKRFGEEGAGDPADIPASGLGVFTALAEEIVDHIADGLEHLAQELGALSASAFRAGDADGRQAIRASRRLRAQLRQVGRMGDRLSEVRDGLLGLGRVVAFVEETGGEWCEGAFKARLASMRRDLGSLSDYEEHLANKVQFVLDALVGFIGIAQNDIFKVLTIVSIVGIPPTLMAGVYGMNFKNIHEYDWAWGYQWGWAVIIVSGLAPLLWFKLKGWF